MVKEAGKSRRKFWTPPRVVKLGTEIARGHSTSLPNKTDKKKQKQQQKKNKSPCQELNPDFAGRNRMWYLYTTRTSCTPAPLCATKWNTSTDWRDRTRLGGHRERGVENARANAAREWMRGGQKGARVAHGARRQREREKQKTVAVDAPHRRSGKTKWEVRRWQKKRREQSTAEGNQTAKNGGEKRERWSKSKSPCQESNLESALRKSKWYHFTTRTLDVESETLNICIAKIELGTSHTDIVLDRQFASREEKCRKQVSSTGTNGKQKEKDINEMKEEWRMDTIQ